MPWSALPTELVVRILEALDPYAILSCRRTCRLLKSVVDDTPALQYRIALHLSGMVDGPPSPLSTSERLSLLRSYETSWKNLDWNTHISLPGPSTPGCRWELYGNVLAHTKADDVIFLVQIPSRLRDIPLRQWAIRLDFPIQAFGMDPSQDLLVAIEMTTYALFRCRIRLRSLSTGEEQRLARDNATLAGPHGYSKYSIRISGDYLGILFINTTYVDDDAHELVVWDWKTGVKCLMGTFFGTSMVSFIFLGDKFFLVSESHRSFDQPSLQLYSLDQALVRNPEIPRSLRFLFPTTLGRSFLSITSDPSPIWPTVSDLRTFLMPASALLEHIRDLETGRDIQWEYWGPATSVVPLRDGWTVCRCFVFGMRHILPWAVHDRDDRRVMIVRDLCPRRYMRASEEEREESNALYEEMGTKEPYPRSIVKSVPLPRNFEDKSHIDFMISEDGIVALEEIGGHQVVHLLTF